MEDIWQPPFPFTWNVSKTRKRSLSSIMPKIPTFLFVVTTALATTIPATSSCYPTRETRTARYDDLTFIEPGPNPIPPHYYGLSYFTFQVDQYDGFIPPTSGNQWTMAFGGSGNISIPSSYFTTILSLLRL